MNQFVPEAVTHERYIRMKMLKRRAVIQDNSAGKSPPYRIPLLRRADMKLEKSGVPGRPIDRRRFLECVAGMGAAASLSRSVFGRGLNETVTGGAQASAALLSGDSRLPDGTAYAAWEKPLAFSKTYYVDNGDAKADDNGPGTKPRPFRTINNAAQLLRPGERVVIAVGHLS